MTDTAALDRATLEPELERYRRELTGYCYRMLGSAFEAEDAVQESFVRAWRSLDDFEGRASLRSWLYRIATNVCFDLLRTRKRRVQPMDIVEVGRGDMVPPEPLNEDIWLQPMPDDRVLPAPGADPAEIALARESIRLAFVAALQHLPARQRAVLILREVLRWRASEVATLLDTSVASVNSALQRARATLGDAHLDEPDASGLASAEQELLARYVDAFERYDIDALVSLLHEDVTMSMPPYPMWLRGPDHVGTWHLGAGIGCRGSRVVPLAVNGQPGIVQWRRADDGTYFPWSIQVLGVGDGRITEIHAFVDPALFALFGFPEDGPTA